MRDYERHYREHERYWKAMPTIYHTQNIWPSSERLQQRKEWILAHAQGDVLDCGCNDGTFIVEVSRRCRVGRTVGIDIISLNIDRAHILYEGAPTEFFVMDVERMSFPDCSFDTVVFTETIEHLIDPGRALSEICRVLRPSGLLLCTTTYIKGEPTHYQDFHDESALARLLEPSFTVESLLKTKEGEVRVVARKR